MCDELYEFNKEYFFNRIYMDALVIEHAESESRRDEARNRMLSIVKDLADAYEAAIKNLNAIELAKSWRSESGETENKENRSEPKPVCKFTWGTMSDRCKRSLARGGYYIFIRPEIERIKKDYERRRKEAVERCFG